METSQSLVLNPNELLTYIEYLRKDLINIGFKYGLNNDRTIEASKQLDYFIYEYQRLNSKLNTK